MDPARVGDTQRRLSGAHVYVSESAGNAFSGQELLAHRWASQTFSETNAPFYQLPACSPEPASQRIVPCSSCCTRCKGQLQCTGGSRGGSRRHKHTTQTSVSSPQIPDGGRQGRLGTRQIKGGQRTGRPAASGTSGTGANSLQVTVSPPPRPMEFRFLREW